jgi:hypothetical protein
MGNEKIGQQLTKFYRHAIGKNSQQANKFLVGGFGHPTMEKNVEGAIKLNNHK